MANTFMLKDNNFKVDREKASWIIFVFSSLLIVVSLIIFKNNKSIATDDNNNSDSLYHISNSNLKIRTINYQGIYFEYTDNLSVDTVEIEDDMVYSIKCKEKTGNSIEEFVILCVNTELAPTDLIYTVMDDYVEDPKYRHLRHTTIYSTSYKQKPADAVKYSVVLYEKIPLFGVIFSFVLNGKTYLITKQTIHLEELDTKFETIENSLRID